MRDHEAEVETYHDHTAKTLPELEIGQDVSRTNQQTPAVENRQITEMHGEVSLA